MEISEVRIKLVPNSTERLRAFCSVTLDCDFVIRDLKIIEGASGVFVAMPSRKLADRCLRCGSKNHLRAKFCNECGVRLRENRAPKDPQGRAKLHADVAHPINAACRERIQGAVIEAYRAEMERAKSPDYRPPSFDDFDEDYETSEETGATAAASERPPRRVEQDAEALGADFSDYNALIADLRRDAADRRKGQDAGEPASGSEDAGEECIISNTNGRKAPPIRSDAPARQASETREPAPASTQAGSKSSGEGREDDDEFGAGLV